MKPTCEASSEDLVRAAIERGDSETAAVLAIELYGAELLGFLLAVARRDSVADDAFSSLLEDLWRGLPAFQWRSSLRTWLYTLARRALARELRVLRRDRARRAAVDRPSRLTEAAVRMRSETPAFVRTTVKDRFADIRAELDGEEQMLLVLRIDRAMTWREIARVMADPGATSDEALDLQAAALRKRFQRLKDRLRTLIQRFRPAD